MDLYTPLLQKFINMLDNNPFVILESALILPGWSNTALKKYESQRQVNFPQSVKKLYNEVGAVHISWRLSPNGYEYLHPDDAIMAYDYNISGNIDLLSPYQMIDGFTNNGWKDIYNNYQYYYPLDFSGYFLNMGVLLEDPRNSGELFMNILYEDRMVLLDVSLENYIRLGIDCLFFVDWQMTLLDGGDSGRQSTQIASLRQKLFGA